MKTSIQKGKELSVLSTSINAHQLRKIMECCFADGGIRVNICGGKEKEGRPSLNTKKDDEISTQEERCVAPQQEVEHIFQEVRRKKKKKKPEGRQS
jgi:hypothetical protein